MVIIIIIIASNLPSSPFSPLPRDSNFSKFKRVRGEIETDPRVPPLPRDKTRTESGIRKIERTKLRIVRSKNNG